MRKDLSSDIQIKTQRANGYAEVAGMVIPGSDIPVRVSQTLTSAIACFNTKLKTHERIINGLQSSLSIICIGLQLSIMLGASNRVELSLKAIDLVYQGTLLGVWGQSELMKGIDTSS